MRPLCILCVEQQESEFRQTFTVFEIRYLQQFGLAFGHATVLLARRGSSALWQSSRITENSSGVQAC